MRNPFGPQTSNASVTIPNGNGAVRFGNDLTWVKDCKADGTGGTVLDSAYFNNMHGNLNYVVNQSGITVNRGDMSALWRAIQKAMDDKIAGLKVVDVFGNEIGRMGTP